MTERNSKLSIGRLSWELLEILISYLKTYLIAAAFFTVFFVFYAGIKTNRISIEVVASIFAALLGSALLWLFFVLLKEEIRRFFRIVIKGLKEEIRGSVLASTATTKEIRELVRVLHKAPSTTIFVAMKILIIDTVVGIVRGGEGEHPIEDSIDESKEDIQGESTILLPKSGKKDNYTHIAR